MRTFRDAPDEMVIAVVERFLLERQRAAAGGKKKTADALVAELSAEWRAKRRGYKTIKREDIYTILAEALDRGMLTVTPRQHQALQAQIAERFGHERESVHVVATESDQPDHVAEHTAGLMIELIREIGRFREPVHVGLGAGWSTRVVAFYLAKRLRSAEDVPSLVLHAISSGFATEQPTTSPVSFFGFFEGVMPKVDLVGLFGPPFVAWDDYERTKLQPGIASAYEHREEIDLVVTSLASASDPDGDITRFMKQGDGDTLRRLKQYAWVGDVQHRPFNERGPITKPTGNRAVTLFELEDLAAMAARPDRHVVLVSVPCNVCHRPRTPALLPLLRVPALKVWSHLVTDIPTAMEILRETRDEPGSKRTRRAA